MKCKQCKKEKAKKKFCSKLCSSRFLQNKHRDTINANARQRLIDNPVQERMKRAAAARVWRAKNKEHVRIEGRKRKDTGLKYDEKDVIFYGYKPPFRKIKDGFGYEGVLLYDKKQGKVQCHFCGLFFRMLNNGHLNKVHGLTARDYKTKVGLSQQSALCGEETRKKLLERGYNPNHMQELRKAQEKRRQRIKKGLPDKQSGFRLSLEKKNERGTCPEQLLERIRDAAKKLGYTPTMEEFRKMNQGKFYGSIRNTYGTWTEAIKKLGMETHHKTYTREQLLDAMRNFYKVHKRTPKWSDMERGLLPSTGPYYRQFKNLNQARLEAGVPLVLVYGKRRDEWIPTNIERKQMLQK